MPGALLSIEKPRLRKNAQVSDAAHARAFVGTLVRPFGWIEHGKVVENNRQRRLDARAAIDCVAGGYIHDAQFFVRIPEPCKVLIDPRVEVGLVRLCYAPAHRKLIFTAMAANPGHQTSRRRSTLGDRVGGDRHLR